MKNRTELPVFRSQSHSPITRSSSYVVTVWMKSDSLKRKKNKCRILLDTIFKKDLFFIQILKHSTQFGDFGKLCFLRFLRDKTKPCIFCILAVSPKSSISCLSPNHDRFYTAKFDKRIKKNVNFSFLSLFYRIKMFFPNVFFPDVHVKKEFFGT